MKVSVGFSFGKDAYLHDVRQSKGKIPEHIDAKYSKDNLIICDEFAGKSKKDYINQLMRPYIDEYNAKQKRADRKINVQYTEYAKNNNNYSKCHGVYEYVAQFGNRNDIGNAYYSEHDPNKKHALKEQIHNIYEKFVNSVRERFPHMKIVYAVVHLDEPEGTPHLHVAFLPVAEGYKNGLSHKISYTKALSNDGIVKSESRLEDKKHGYQEGIFVEMVKEIFREIVKEFGYEIKETIKRDPKDKVKHRTPEEEREFVRLVEKEYKSMEETYKTLHGGEEPSDSESEKIRRWAEQYALNKMAKERQKKKKNSKRISYEINETINKDKVKHRTLEEEREFEGLVEKEYKSMEATYKTLHGGEEPSDSESEKIRRWAEQYALNKMVKERQKKKKKLRIEKDEYER